jgi:hypothetical protein
MIRDSPDLDQAGSAVTGALVRVTGTLVQGR